MLASTVVAVVVVLAVTTTCNYVPQTCRLTDPDGTGPFYLPGAPTSTEQLCANSVSNDRLILTGQVVDYDSKCMRGVPNVKLDLWQADADGIYSTGQNANEWFCRGIFVTDANGRFRITTILPGRYAYLDGYRPAHIHFNITVKGYPQLITQLYFEHDMYLFPRDSCGAECNGGKSKSLRLSTSQPHDLKTFEGDWKIVLSKTQRVSYPSMSNRTRRQGAYIQIHERTKY